MHPYHSTRPDHKTKLEFILHVAPAGSLCMQQQSYPGAKPGRHYQNSPVT